jgi:hypothetical protein
MANTPLSHITLDLLGLHIVGHKRIHEKPSGELGAVRVTNNGGTPLVEFRRFGFPQEKKAQEALIANLFVSSLNAGSLGQWTLQQLDENDFDFELRCADEKRYLELQELVIPPKKRGPPYADREQVIHPGKFAKSMISKIAGKAISYPKTL